VIPTQTYPESDYDQELRETIENAMIDMDAGKERNYRHHTFGKMRIKGTDQTFAVPPALVDNECGIHLAASI